MRNLYEKQTKLCVTIETEMLCRGRRSEVIVACILMTYGLLSFQPSLVQIGPFFVLISFQLLLIGLVLHILKEQYSFFYFKTHTRSYVKSFNIRDSNYFSAFENSFGNTFLCFLWGSLWRRSAPFEWSGAARLVCLPLSRLQASATASFDCPCRERRSRGGEGDKERVLWVASPSAVSVNNTWNNSKLVFFSDRSSQRDNGNVTCVLPGSPATLHDAVTVVGLLVFFSDFTGLSGFPQNSFEHL